MEWWLRRYVRDANKSNSALWPVILHSGALSTGDPYNATQRCPNTTLAYRMYGYDAECIAAADIRTNNLGFISHRDYSYEREAGEFRIVIIGGEQSASSVSDQSWPDLLEEELNRRDTSVRYRVFNLAWPDAGPEHYVKAWQNEGHKFSPDLTIVNYVETDFYRPLVGAPLRYQGHPVANVLVEYRVGPGLDDVAAAAPAIVQGFMATSFRHPKVIPARPYGFQASRSFVKDARRVRMLQRQVVDDMVEGVMPRFGALTLRMLTGKPVNIDVSRVRDFDVQAPMSDPRLDRPRMIEFGIVHFGWLAETVPNLVITHNFHYYELNQPFEFTDAMVAQAPHIRVLDMRGRIPAGTTDEELRSWYQFPQMVEKWSARGHRAYARMMAEVVLDRRGVKWTDGAADWGAFRRTRNALSQANARQLVARVGPWTLPGRVHWCLQCRRYLWHKAKERLGIVKGGARLDDGRDWVSPALGLMNPLWTLKMVLRDKRQRDAAVGLVKDMIVRQGVLRALLVRPWHRWRRRHASPFE
ncbi:MAG TPA: hypothetical protein VKW09_04535 [bacterium]|nr:hypothetical protein [bacterium]